MCELRFFHSLVFLQSGLASGSLALEGNKATNKTNIDNVYFRCLAKLVSGVTFSFWLAWVFYIYAICPTLVDLYIYERRGREFLAS